MGDEFEDVVHIYIWKTEQKLQAGKNTVVKRHLIY